ncbi:leucine-rich repeat protein [Perkinsela sp. CCAP 1560/4]|nr:leucine-rich repeat protein [Perkinsela sp. CCAP 1560/4]|eukprot:KNH09573.1 leucine-rich repeat protein [Perkinsela sp. CCAP 1560/4]
MHNEQDVYVNDVVNRVMSEHSRKDCAECGASNIASSSHCIRCMKPLHDYTSPLVPDDSTSIGSTHFSQIQLSVEDMTVELYRLRTFYSTIAVICCTLPYMFAFSFPGIVLLFTSVSAAWWLGDRARFLRGKASVPQYIQWPPISRFIPRSITRNKFLKVYYYSLLISLAFLVMIFLFELLGIHSCRKKISRKMFFFRFLFDAVYMGTTAAATYNTHKLVTLLKNVAI